MKLLYLTLLLLLPFFCAAQSEKSLYAESDFFLLLNEPTHAIFILNRQTEQNKLTKSDKFAFYNRLIDAFSQQQHTDTLQKLFLLSEKLSPTNSFEKTYFSYLKAAYEKDQDGLTTLLTKLKTTDTESYLLKGRINFQLGNYLLDESQIEESLKVFQNTLINFQKDSIHSFIRIAETRGVMAIIHKINKEYDASIFNNTLAIRILEKSPYPKPEMLAKYYNNIGNVYNEQLNYKQAQFYYTKSLQLKEMIIRDSTLLSTTYQNLGIFYSNFGNYYKSKEFYTKSLNFLSSDQEASKKKIPGYYSNIGSYYKTISEPTKALDYYLKALNKANAILPKKDRLFFVLYLNIGTLYKDQDRMNLANQYFDYAENFLNENFKKGNPFEVYLPIARTTYPHEEEKWPLYKAINLKYIQRLEDMDQDDVDQISYLNETLNNTGNIYLDLRQLDSAKIYFLKGLSYNQNIYTSESPLLCFYLNNMGMIHYLDNNFDSAQHYFNKAIENNILKKSNNNPEGPLYADPFEFMVSETGLLKLEEKKYIHNATTLADLKQSLKRAELVEQIINERRGATEMTQDKLLFSKKVFEFYEAALNVLFLLHKTVPEESYLSQLFHYSELAKSQSLLLSLREDNLKLFSDVPEVLLQQESDLKQKLKILNIQLTEQLSLGDEADLALTEEFTNEYATNVQHFDNFLDSLKNNLPDYYNLKFNRKVVSVEDIRKDILTPSSALIEYHVGDSAIYGQVITKNKGFVFKVNHADQIKAKIVGFKNQISYQLDDAFKETSYAIYQQIFYPVDSFFRAEKLKVKEINIATSDILGYLPFEALRRNESSTSKPDYLINSYSISYTYSATLLWQKHAYSKSQETRANGFIGFAPIFSIENKEAIVASRSTDVEVTPTEERRSHDDFNFRLLAETATEISQIGDLFKAKKINYKIVDGEDADEHAVKTSKLYNYKYIHFATHGFLDMQNPQLSGIALTRNTASKEDDILYGDEIYNLKLNADLVCLSACETGLGKIYKGEGIIGLTRGFLYAGAKNVMVSLWKVPDKSTSLLMTDFFRNLLQTQNNSEALRKSKLAMVKSKNYSHPYYWAPFVLIGK